MGRPPLSFATTCGAGTFEDVVWIRIRSFLQRHTVKLRPRFLAALVVIVCVSPVPALAGQMTVGIHGGLTRARFSDLDATVEGDSRSGVRFGVPATIPVSGGLGLRFEGNYVRAGGGRATTNVGRPSASKSE